MQLRLQAIDDIHLFSVPLFYEDGNSLDAIKRQEKELNINSSDYSDTEDPKRNSEGELHPLLSNFSVYLFFVVVTDTAAVTASTIPMYSEKTLAVALVVAIVSALVFGIFVGILISQKCCPGHSTVINNNTIDTPFSIKVSRKPSSLASKTSSAYQR